jgi:hypothetical protein
LVRDEPVVVATFQNARRAFERSPAFLWREAFAQFGGSPFAVKRMIAQLVSGLYWVRQ